MFEPRLNNVRQMTDQLILIFYILFHINTLFPYVFPAPFFPHGLILSHFLLEGSSRENGSLKENPPLLEVTIVI
jgi:hypothetical protein